MRLFWYAARIKSGAMDGSASPEIDGGLGALATRDGKGGLGQVVAHAAMTQAIARAKDHGLGAVTVRNSGHFGTAMCFTKMAAEAGCIGFLSTNASPAMAPWETCGHQPLVLGSTGGAASTDDARYLQHGGGAREAHPCETARRDHP
jgi:LDH2 family malate/lactate/ureidoglycolate dehydrogenase